MGSTFRAREQRQLSKDLTDTHLVIGSRKIPRWPKHSAKPVPRQRSLSEMLALIEAAAEACPPTDNATYLRVIHCWWVVAKALTQTETKPPLLALDLPWASSEEKHLPSLVPRQLGSGSVTETRRHFAEKSHG